MSDLYVAIDPGGTTGLAWLIWEDGEWLFGSDQIGDRYETEWWVDRTVGITTRDTTVIIERWDVRANTHQLTNQDDPRYIIGWVDGFCHFQPHVTYVEQTPAQAKRFGDDLKLKRMGWYVKGEDHARDAARHLLTYLAKDPGDAGDYVREGLTQ